MLAKQHLLLPPYIEAIMKMGGGARLLLSYMACKIN
jgi:hypothetical protein